MTDFERTAEKEKGMRNISFETKLTEIINIFGKESESNTPDFILAQYISNCLSAFNEAVQKRETWYGRDARPTEQAALKAAKDI